MPKRQKDWLLGAWRRWKQGLNVDLVYKNIAIAACLLTIAGAKFWVINSLGSHTPFWDEWNSVGVLIFKPFVDGALPISNLFAFNNEHRIFFTRLIDITFLELNGYWDPVLEMKFNAFIHVAAIGCYLIAVRKTVAKGPYLLFCAFAAAVIAIPFGWENILVGFQSNFYCLLLFSVASLWFLLRSPAFRPFWWLGLLCAIASYFSMASGALTVVAGIGVALVQIVLGSRRGVSEVLALATQGVLFAAMASDIPISPEVASLRAHSITQFANAFLSAVGWPISSPPILASAIMYAPVLLVTVLMIRERPSKEDCRWFVVGAAAWLAVEFASLAFGRAVGTLASRYLDIMIFGVVLNFLCLLIVLNSIKYRPWSLGAITTVWLLAVGAGIGGKAISYLPSQLAEKFRQTTAETKNLSDYLATGDISYLKDKPSSEIPYPSAEELAQIVSLPEIHAILPPSLISQSKKATDGGGVWSRRLAIAVGLALKALGIRSGETLLPLGLVLFLIIAVNFSTSAVSMEEDQSRPAG